MRRLWRSLALALTLFASLVYVNNTSLFASRSSEAPTLLAHRGIAQQFDTANLRNDTCTASRMRPPTHSFLENTIPSMQASFDAGADIVEIDVHPTTDSQFAVFHDWTLDCRTNGSGVTREHSMAELKKLDVGYGYTADGGKTFPFRGTGVGLMPTLEEVLTTFPSHRFLINIKSRDRSEGAKLAGALEKLPRERRDHLLVYGGDEPVAELKQRLPALKTMSRGTLKSCLLGYIGIGWTGYVPEACRNALVLVPINVAPWLWGWPDRFLERMRSSGSEVFVLGPYGGGEFSTGIDRLEDLQRLPTDYSGGIWTNELERVVSALKKEKL